MSDSSDIDAALVAKLLGDASLMALVPDGVFFDMSNEGAKRFVIVSLTDETDDLVFGGRGFETATYLVKAVMLSSSGGNIKAAAARIDALLENGTLNVSGYTVMSIRRESRIRTTEPNDQDPTIRWFHRGGRYEVMATL
jgi:hypothetical protein